MTRGIPCYMWLLAKGSIVSWADQIWERCRQWGVEASSGGRTEEGEPRGAGQGAPAAVRAGLRVQGLLRAHLELCEGREGLRPDNGSALGPAQTLGGLAGKERQALACRD